LGKIEWIKKDLEKMERTETVKIKGTEVATGQET
jgi:hypothetical protein